MDEHDMVTAQVMAELRPDAQPVEPLIYTTKGNVPESTLIYAHEWIDTPDVMKFVERYTDKATGDVVKESCHVYLKRGLLAEASAGSFA